MNQINFCSGLFYNNPVTTVLKLMQNSLKLSISVYFYVYFYVHYYLSFEHVQAVTTTPEQNVIVSELLKSPARNTKANYE